MRLIEAENLKEGMTLGKTIYGSNGQVLLQRGIKLSDVLIGKIRNLDMGCVYIEDGFSDGIEIVDIIDEKLRQSVIGKTKAFFTSVESGDLRAIQKESREIDQMISQIVEQITSNPTMMVNLVDLKTYDDYTFQHCVNVCVLSTALASAMSYRHIALLELAKSALFHDIGKMMISKKIIMKPDKLTFDEFEEVKTHPVKGAMFAKTCLKFSDAVLNGILEHHEKCNGEGYPEGRHKKGISKNAKIIAICDVYDAITSKRVYHEAVKPSEAFEYIMGNADQHFDADIVNIFLRKVAAYPLGTEVKLNNGMSGLVCENKEGFTLRPKIKVFTPEMREDVYVDLSEIEYSTIAIVASA